MVKAKCTILLQVEVKPPAVIFHLDYSFCMVFCAHPFSLHCIFFYKILMDGTMCTVVVYQVAWHFIWVASLHIGIK